MKKCIKVASVIMAGIVLLAFGGCGKKTEEKTKGSRSVKTHQSDNSDSSTRNIASTLVFTKKTDAYEKTITVNFDKDELIIDGKAVTVYTKESDAVDEYKYIEEAVQQGSILDAKLEGNTITQTFDINSSTLSSISFAKESRNKTNYRRYCENLNFECKEV